MTLPLDSFSASAAVEDTQEVRQQCAYTLTTISQCLRHASSLLKLNELALSVLDSESGLVAWRELVPWVIDSYLRLYETQGRWQSAYPSGREVLVQNALKLLATLSKIKEFDLVILQKAQTLLTLLCIEFSDACTHAAFFDDRDSSNLQTLCTALVRISAACMQYKPLAKLVASQLIPVVEKLMLQGESLVAGTDLQVYI